MGLAADRFRRHLVTKPTVLVMYCLAYETRRQQEQDWPYFGTFSGFLYMKEQKKCR